MARSSSSTDLWAHVADERREVLDLLRGLTPEQWVAPSLCAGWRIRDVAAHLLVDDPVRELGAASVLVRMARWRFDVHKANAWWVEHNADRPVASIIDRFEQSLVPGPMSRLMGPGSGLRASVIHHQDMRRPLGLHRTIPPERMVAVLDAVLTTKGSINLGSRQRAEGIRLRATDLEWSRGDGPEVTGPAEAILMALAGRTGALTELAGDGRDRLAATSPAEA
jgi:uncharacterized protein (TIGR03083 family)